MQLIKTYSHRTALRLEVVFITFYGPNTDFSFSSPVFFRFMCLNSTYYLLKESCLKANVCLKKKVYHGKKITTRTCFQKK